MKSTKTYKLISGILALVFFSISTFPAFATEFDKSPAISEDALISNMEEQAFNMIGEQVDISIASSHKLKKFGSQSEYTFMELFPKGYAICDDESGVIEEFVPDAEVMPYNFSENRNYYYAGPMNYIEKSGETFVNLLNNTILGSEDVEYFKNLVSEISRKRSVTNSVESSISPCYVPDRTVTVMLPTSDYFTDKLEKNYANNTTEICTHVACEIMLGYYDYYVNDNIVPKGYEASGDYGTNALFNPYLQTFLGSSACGLAKAATGLNQYFSAIYFSGITAKCEIGDHDAVFDKVKDYIAKRRPVVAAMFHSHNSACPINHSVVVYGYQATYRGQNLQLSSATLYVHNGWWNNPLGSYSYDWFADVLYLE